MSLISLFSDEHGFLLTDQLVYKPEQLRYIQDAAVLSAELSTAIDNQNRVNEQAQTEGFEAGYEKGLLQAKAEAEKELQQAKMDLHASYERDVENQKQACASLAVDIVRKIAGQVAPADWLVAEAKTAAADLVDRSGLVLRVHRSQYESVCERVAQTDLFERVIADEAVAVNACSIDTRYGKIDVDIDTQIDQVLALLARGEPTHV